MTAPQTQSSKKRHSPASKAGQMERLLKFQQKLVVEKGLPKTRIQTELDITPGAETFQGHAMPSKCRKNLLVDFQELEPNTEAPCPTFPSMTQAGGNCVGSKSESANCNGNYRKVVSSGHKNLSSLSHSRYESVQKDNISPHITSVQSPDYPECGKDSCSISSQVVYLIVLSPDSQTNEKVHVPSAQNPDFKEESERAEQENYQTNAQSSMQEALLPQGSVYLPSGWYLNVGAAYCGGCQLYGSLLQRLQM